ncbi:MAG: peptidase M48 [Polaromonas sp. 24-62-144]|jgi:Zn-dependent protease with chaperone function|uniref:M48 family metallopeptidase n=1 Tax=Polaromonas sp. TaxID=1869339 RepID=UPI000BCFA964|nr:M48 family metallopeptidase [Polaromonas sp.]OYY53221.1 MAG: peptidase M48 [Polaromonas sp. 35-63-240]OYZ00403.1 MAG: peptidase M48 [Polaromonas sp. 28-63-22]OYZ84381.1 MAG: peptidase M48 [Polaromonas sp. 24-62-144]HQS31152.1 M48 family metallopeptidase [Polaromonas sp.]HQS90755.1 M48 family metallopeptidase [Polaromonas sp.]
MCFRCDTYNAAWPGRRAFLLAAAGSAATAALTTPALAQVNVGKASQLRNLVPADELETAATQEYSKLLSEARSQGALAQPGNPQLQRLRTIAAKLIPQTAQWNDRAKSWKWEVNLIGSKQVNAFCMPGGKIAFYTGILDQLKLTDDEVAMIMGHEMAHALREHARARIAKTQGTGTLLSLGAQLFGLGDLGGVAANIGTQLISLRFSRDDETDADLVGLELAARGGYNPQAAVSLWEKMGQAGGGSNGPSFLSTHPSGPARIQQLQANVPKVQGLYQRARSSG